MQATRITEAQIRIDAANFGSYRRNKPSVFRKSHVLIWFISSKLNENQGHTPPISRRLTRITIDMTTQCQSNREKSGDIKAQGRKDTILSPTDQAVRHEALTISRTRQATVVLMATSPIGSSAAILMLLVGIPSPCSVGSTEGSLTGSPASPSWLRAKGSSRGETDVDREDDGQSPKYTVELSLKGIWALQLRNGLQPWKDLASLKLKSVPTRGLHDEDASA